MRKNIKYFTDDKGNLINYSELDDKAKFGLASGDIFASKFCEVWLKADSEYKFYLKSAMEHLIKDYLS